MNGAEYIPRPGHGAAWLTGASAGIGKAVAARLVEDGWTVYVTARSEDRLREMAAGVVAGSSGSIIPAPGDVTDPEAMKAIVARIEAEHGLALAILNAGVYIPMTARDFTVEDARKHFDVNLQGVVNGLVPAMQAMLAKNRGCLALVASVAGYRGLPKAGAYGATKAALINMAEALAYNLYPEGVRISLICPGFVETEATSVNDFEMPFLMQADEAANRIVDGLRTTKFEIAFPRRFAFLLKSFRLLPAKWYIALGRKAMGMDKD